MLSRFWEKSLAPLLKTASDEAEKVIQLVGKACPKCARDLIYKFSKAGKFIGCSGYPECDFTDQPKEEKDMLDALRKKYEGKPCPEGIE